MIILIFVRCIRHVYTVRRVAVFHSKWLTILRLAHLTNTATETWFGLWSVFIINVLRPFYILIIATTYYGMRCVYLP